MHFFFCYKKLQVFHCILHKRILRSDVVKFIFQRFPSDSTFKEMVGGRGKTGDREAVKGHLKSR